MVFVPASAAGAQAVRGAGWVDSRLTTQTYTLNSSLYPTPQVPAYMARVGGGRNCLYIMHL